jgi:hypothetical protein
MNIKKLVEQRTLQLLKRFDCKTAQELEQIASREYATDHFDITTVKLIVEALLKDALKAGLTKKQVAELGKGAWQNSDLNYGIDSLLSAKMRELKQWQDNRSIHGTKTPKWIKRKVG